jgi:hypothetical protein
MKGVGGSSMKIVAHDSLAWLVGKLHESSFDLELQPDNICNMPYILWEVPRPSIIFLVAQGRLGALEHCLNSTATEMWPDAKVIAGVIEPESQEVCEKLLVKLVLNFPFSYKLFSTKLAFAEYLNCLGVFWTSRKEMSEPKRKTRTKMIDEPNDHRATWLRMLLAVPGVTEPKANAVAKTYPSLSALMRAYKDSGDQGDQLLATVKSGSIMLGKALSKRIHDAFS